jgi:hypothetical protein
MPVGEKTAVRGGSISTLTGTAYQHLSFAKYLHLTL